MTTAAGWTPTASTWPQSSSGCWSWCASDECDVAVGSRFLPESGSEGERYKPTPERVVGTSLLRLLMRLRLGQPISDGTSGLYAVDQKALELLADDYLCEAPEVEALMRITDAKLRLVEVPVHMRQREHGESSFRGKRAVGAGGHDRPDAVRGQAPAPTPRAPPTAGHQARAARCPAAAEAIVSASVPASCTRRPS